MLDLSEACVQGILVRDEIDDFGQFVLDTGVLPFGRHDRADDLFCRLPSDHLPEAAPTGGHFSGPDAHLVRPTPVRRPGEKRTCGNNTCLLYTSDAADE